MPNKLALKNKVEVSKKSVAFATDFLHFTFIILTSLFSGLISAESVSMTLAERVTFLELRAQSQSKIQADLSYQFADIQRQIRELTGQIEEHDFKLKQIQDRQRDLYRDIEYRLSNLSTTGSVKLTPPKDNKVKLLVSSTNAHEANITPDDTKVQTTPLARREFEKAFALVRSKKYKASIVAFQSFLKNYPTTSYSANARYWMGQVYLVQGSSDNDSEALDNAAKQFTLLTSEFPNSTKTANAMLKLGDIYVKQKKWVAAKTYYSRVSENYTGTKQQLAKNALQKIREAGY